MQFESCKGLVKKSENIYVKRYARFVMQDVVCCSNTDDLELYAKSVSQNRLRFQNKCLQRMRKQEHFIGVDALEKQLQTAKKRTYFQLNRISSFTETQGPIQQNFTARYVCDYPSGLAGVNGYQQEYLSLQHIELERHRENLQAAQKLCKERFRKGVLFRMKDDIQNAIQQFRQINQVMENLEYGEESYRFSIAKSKDKELALFYDIIMDKNKQQIEHENNLMAFLAESNKQEVFESKIEDFMSRIIYA